MKHQNRTPRSNGSDRSFRTRGSRSQKSWMRTETASSKCLEEVTVSVPAVDSQRECLAEVEPSAVKDAYATAWTALDRDLSTALTQLKNETEAHSEAAVSGSLRDL